MFRRISFWVVFAYTAVAAQASVTLTTLKCEYLTNPLGIDANYPGLSWQLESNQRGQKQTAYQILVAGSKEMLKADKPDLWDSGKINSDQSIQVVYNGKKLTSRMRCYWKVRIWDKNGKPTEYSDPAWWEMGLLEGSDFNAKWLSAPWPKQSPPPAEPCPFFRKAFSLAKSVKKARAYITGLGYYELYINGQKTGDHVLDPAFTRYDKRVLYVTYDVTDQLKRGKNALGVILGNGWYNMHTTDTWEFYKAPWRAKPTVLCRLEIEFKDGTKETIISDSTWKVSSGPIVFDGIRNGETYDAGLEKLSWNTPDYNDADWQPVEVVPGPKGKLVAQMLPPIKITKTLKPVKITEPKPGVYVFDMGQNMAGWAKLKVKGPAGTKILMRHEERLNPDGTVDREMNSKHVKQGDFQTSTYILKGKGTEIWQPRFTYYGFRYVEVTGFPGKPSLENLTACVVNTSFDTAGTFECSKDMFNKIQQCTLWSYISNFHGYPTDCPHREKQGWTGDAHLAAETGLYNFASQPAYTKWMNDFKDEQRPAGDLPGIVPTGGWGYEIIWEKGREWQGGFGPAWDSAYVLIPWYLYLYCGDVRILAEHYDGMKRYLDNLTSNYTDDYIAYIGLSDWCPVEERTPKQLTSTGYYFRDTVVLSRIAQLLNKPEDAAKYAELALKIKDAFNRHFFDANTCQYAGGTQTALSCALYQDLVEPQNRQRVLDNLVSNIERHNWHLDAGILGTKYLLNTLTDNGRADVVYKIAAQTTYPSYGHWLAQGATTLWEQWDGINSQNHIMFGDISRWFYRALAGIDLDPASVGFKRIIIHPRPLGDLKWVRAEHDSMYGRIKSSWHKDGNKFSLDVTVPANTTATVYVPATSVEAVTESGKPAAKADGVTFLRIDDGAIVFALDSGSYSFVAKGMKKP